MFVPTMTNHTKEKTMTDRTLDIWLNRTPRPTPPVWPSSATSVSTYLMAEARWHSMRSGELVWMACKHLVTCELMKALCWAERVFRKDSAIGRKARAALTYLYARG
jgi:hypothetical protein